MSVSKTIQAIDVCKFKQYIIENKKMLYYQTNKRNFLESICLKMLDTKEI